MKLNVGCGKDIREGYVNLDRATLTGVDVVCDLETCMTAPFPANTFSEIYMSHVLEHVVNPLRVMWLLWEMAKPGCRATIRTPYGSSDSAWEDPTHVRPYYLGSFLYFSQLAYARADYGYVGDWRTLTRTIQVEPDLIKFSDDLDHLLLLVHRGRNLVRELTVVLEAVKPARLPDSGEHEASPIQFDFRP